MKASVHDRLHACWSRSDQIFDLLEGDALFEQPIGLRHPLVFYLGHLPAFAWNQVCRGVLEMPSFRPEFDILFERGIDPTDVDHYESTTEWPAVEDILEYRDRVRSALLEAIDPDSLEGAYAVVEGVRENVNLGFVPRFELAVGPNPINLVDHRAFRWPWHQTTVSCRWKSSRFGARSGAHGRSMPSRPS